MTVGETGVDEMVVDETGVDEPGINRMRDDNFLQMPCRYNITEKATPLPKSDRGICFTQNINHVHPRQQILLSSPCLWT